MARFLRRLHRLHRALGTLLCVLMASWFLSGAVMTFASYPYYAGRARFRDLEPLRGAEHPTPEPLAAALATFMRTPGSELSLTRVAGELRWLLSRHGEVLSARAIVAPYAFAALDERRVRALGAALISAPVSHAALLTESDQWTVPLPRSLFPLWQLAFADRARSQLYVSAASGEIVQRTTREQRVLAWLGAIPHWIYPTMLRRERALWKGVVIALACLGLILTSAGLMAGLDTARRVRLRRQRTGSGLNDLRLRLHQRIGLGFGVLALCWLFSGILSFNPFDWTASRGLHAQAALRLEGPRALPVTRLDAAWARCQLRPQARELRIRYLAGVPVALCFDVHGRAESVLLDQPAGEPARALSSALLASAARALVPAGQRFHAQLVDLPDQYYYPTHTEPDLVLPYLRIDAEDSVRTRSYLDPHTGELLRTLTQRSRLERFLFHGLHSWDFEFLYRQRGLWQALVLTAMAVGATLSLLGLGLALRRMRRRRQKKRRLRQRRMADDVIEKSGQSVG